MSKEITRLINTRATYESHMLKLEQEHKESQNMYAGIVDNLNKQIKELEKDNSC